MCCLQSSSTRFGLLYSHLRLKSTKQNKTKQTFLYAPYKSDISNNSTSLFSGYVFKAVFCSQKIKYESFILEEVHIFVGKIISNKRYVKKTAVLNLTGLLQSCENCYPSQQTVCCKMIRHFCLKIRKRETVISSWKTNKQTNATKTGTVKKPEVFENPQLFNT